MCCYGNTTRVYNLYFNQSCFVFPQLTRKSIPTPAPTPSGRDITSMHTYILPAFERGLRDTVPRTSIIRGTVDRGIISQHEGSAPGLQFHQRKSTCYHRQCHHLHPMITCYILHYRRTLPRYHHIQSPSCHHMIHLMILTQPHTIPHYHHRMPYH